ncbi:integrator complex subunit 7 isoform X1 [Danaus plexippus]|uniref:integrator complex subunit 7 isoform X1 n=2 Tax=Danaus plexippus TaxID=13037 RepID=UPI002AB2C02C|nr:integrator complex subunit 7 isoform X1 [Danaus plexippus]
MIGVRLNSFSDNSGEPEQDANSALTELDKGLRSGKVGEQCEAIVRFPRLFEKYPFPILINSSFLKLADVFRMGNNFLRLWVLRVCQQSEKHLDKILNVDEFLRRVYSVLHSNDPVARALALRTLGAVAGIIPERQNVHHAIRRGLESHDNVEVDAAIYATTRFAAHSNSFAVAMCNKLSDMVECESTGVERRAKLVRALRTVHGGAVRAQGVLKLLRSLLERFPSSSSVRAAITALTAIAADTVVHVPDQVELLLKLAVNDARSAVRRAALVGLRKLAEHAALWPTDCIQDLVHAASEMQDDEHSMLCLQVMQILVRCPAVCAAAGPEASLRRHCSAAALSVNMKLAAIAADVLTRIVAHCYEENLPVEGSELMLALESLVIATGMDNGQNNIRPLRIALRCLVQLSSSAPHLYASRTAGVLGSAAQSSVGPRQAALLEGLAALGALGASAAPYLIPALERAKEDCKDPTYDGTTLVLICTVLLQERAVAALRYRIRGSWEERIKDAVRGADGWTRYRVARTALRYGHHRLAGELLEQLATQAPSEAAQRWLTALHRAAAADRLLEDEGVSALEEASAGWQSFAVGAVGAGVGAGGCVGCAGCGACTSLCAAWAAARARGLAALARAAAAARALCTQPPPAIAMQHAQAARDPASKSGACAGALRRASAALSAVAKSYAALARMSFYADDTTLRLLYISQHTYGLMSQFLERITSGQEWEVRPVSARSLEETLALAPAHALAGVAAQLFDHPATGAGITHRHAEAVVAGVRALCRGIVWPRAVCAGGAGGAPCRVSLSPAPRAPPADHAAALPLAHRLAVKLEGVLLPPPGKMKNKRQVKGVQITVTATPHPRTNEKTVELTNVQPTLTAVQTVTPVRDFFSAQQLVSVPAPGLYTVAVEAAFVDEKGQLWHTGPRSCIVIKAHEDPGTKGNSQTSRSRF